MIFVTIWYKYNTIRHGATHYNTLCYCKTKYWFLRENCFGVSAVPIASVIKLL